MKNIGELEDLLNILSYAIGSLTNPEKLMILSKRLLSQKILYSPIMMTMVS